MGKPPARKRRLRKIVDEETVVSCETGVGIMREELWVDESGEIARYNLAFINHFLCNVDNGRVLGYDNRHGSHHRHFKGKVEPFIYEAYDLLLERFRVEMNILRKGKP